MRRTALVIGAQTGGLSGVHHDVDVMTAILSDRGFAVDSRRERDATQAGVREGLQRLVRSAGDDDAVVIYFSGHGNVAVVQSLNGIRLPERRFIVPTDYEQSRPGDFRGITAIELSVWVARLTERTRNVTVILDCCHAARMVRDTDLVAKVWPHPTYLDIAEHTGALRAAGLDTGLLDPSANPWAVRLLACAPEQSAFEFGVGGGQRGGAFTDSLRVALTEARSARVSWSALMRRVRDRVSALSGGQRPELEGPGRRLPFVLDEPASDMALPVDVTGADRVRLPGAALLGAAVGDEFALTGAGGAVPSRDAAMATAVVDTVDGININARVRLRDSRTVLQDLVEAHPLTISAVRDPVRVVGSTDLAQQLRSRIDMVPTLRAVDDDTPGPVLAEVTVAQELELRDGGPQPLATAAADRHGVDHVVANLRRIARTAVLRRLAPGPAEALTDPFDVQWGRVVEGRQAQELPRSGAVVHNGERIWLTLRNQSSRNLYFFVFDLGVGHTVTLISVEAHGVLLPPGQELTLGERIDGQLPGTPLFWPAHIPATEPRPESLLVLATAEPHDLSGLAQDGVRDYAVRGDTSLARALLGALGGAPRDWPRPTTTSSSRFAAVHVDFDLVPAAPVPEVATFVVDERTFPSAALLTPRGGRQTRSATPSRQAERTVAVRVTELVVHSNRTLGSADIRIDSLVLTGGGGDRLPELARTAVFPRVRDGDRLSLENLLVYHGPAADYLDLAWWVSRDDGHGRALSDLLHERLTDPTFRDAVGSLSSIAPQVAVGLSAITAGTIIVNTAYQLLSQAVRGTIGLYRTSFLPGENFGIGRHPLSGLATVQDFAFAYEIVGA